MVIMPIIKHLWRAVILGSKFEIGRIKAFKRVNYNSHFLVDSREHSGSFRIFDDFREIFISRVVLPCDIYLQSIRDNMTLTMAKSSGTMN